jgi:hypothetical protein
VGWQIPADCPTGAMHFKSPAHPTAGLALKSQGSPFAACTRVLPGVHSLVAGWQKSSGPQSSEAHEAPVAAGPGLHVPQVPSEDAWQLRLAQALP